MTRVAVYPGSFDPLTNGHVDIIERAVALFGRLIVAVLVNADKRPMFSVEERLEILRTEFKDDRRVEADAFDGLLVDYAARRGADVIVKGLRSGADFEFEQQMALMNRRLEPSVETIFMMASAQFDYVSSRLVKEVAALGGSVHGLVPVHVESRLNQRRRSAVK